MQHRILYQLLYKNRHGSNHVLSRQNFITWKHCSAHDTNLVSRCINRLTYSMLHVCILGVTACTCVCCLTDDIGDFFYSFHLWIISHRCDGTTDVLLKICMVYCLYGTVHISLISDNCNGASASVLIWQVKWLSSQGPQCSAVCGKSTSKTTFTMLTNYKGPFYTAACTVYSPSL